MGIVKIAALGIAWTLVHLPVAEAQQQRKYTRSTPKAQIKVRKTKHTRGIARKVPTRARPPAVTPDDVLNIWGAVKGVRLSQIRSLERLIAATETNHPDMPKLLFRLADLYGQQQRYWQFKAFELYKQIENPRHKRRKQSLRAEQRDRFSKASRFLKRSMRVYRELTSNNAYRNYARMDLALFRFAHTLRSAKRMELARTVFKKLIQNYPESRFVADALLAFADHYFEQNELARAERFYDRVLRFPKSAIYSYALYKKGWVYLNQNRNQAALTAFFDVAKRTDGDTDREHLNKMSKRDYVRAYAQVGKARMAYVAFKRVDKAHARNMLRALAFLYFDEGQPRKAIYSFRELMKLAPTDKHVCEYQYNVVQAMLSAGNKKQKVAEVDKLNRIYRSFADRKLIAGNTLAECRDNAMVTTAELAKLWHIEGLKTRDSATLAQAERLYRSYFAHHRAARDIGEMRYYYAELLWERADREQNERLAAERWEKAAGAFRDVVAGGKADSKLTEESAYAGALAWWNALKLDSTPTDVPAARGRSNKPKPRKIAPRERKMLAAFNTYIRYVKRPRKAELVRMKFFEARVYWKHDQLAKAIPLFTNIVEKHPTHETARYSANILLDSLNRLERYDDLIAAVDRMLARPKFLADKKDLAARLKFIKAQSRRRFALDRFNAGSFIECGLLYREIYDDDPDGKDMDEVLYNAGVCFLRGKSIGLAIAMFRALNGEFPASVHSKKALALKGRALGQVAMYGRAAVAYEEYARKYAGEQDASSAMSNAVTYRLGIGDDDAAIRNIEYFIRTFGRKNKAEAAQAMLGLVDIYEKRKDYDQVVKTYERYLAQIGTSGGRHRMVMAHGRIGEILWMRSCRKASGDGSCVRITRDRATRKRRTRNRRRGALPERCGDDDSKIKLTVQRRASKLVLRAQKHFRIAINHSKKITNIGSSDPRMAVATFWASASEFYLAEEAYENYLRIQIPSNLDFNPRKPRIARKSTERLLQWLEKKDAVAATTNAAYKRVLRGKSAVWAVAAAARMGQIPQNFADQLFTAKVPKFVRTGPYAEVGWNTYCDSLAEKAAPLEDRSIAAFSACLRESTKRSWFNRWSKMCERELGQIRSEDFPTANELHGSADRIGAITDVQGIEPLAP